MNLLLEVKKLRKDFPIEKGIFQTAGWTRAVDDVSFSIRTAETVALVGESGSGKSTVAKMIQGLVAPTEGNIFFNGEDAEKFSRRDRARNVQMIFQDPYASLNPKLAVGTMLGEALSQSGSASNRSGQKEAIESLLLSVGLPGNILGHYPHQFSGGQRQRLGIARALALKPKLLIADEPVSALDLSVQAQILNLLAELKGKFSIAYLLIAHDLSVVEQMADRVLVMRAGRILEEGGVEAIFGSAQESYTRELLSAVPQVP